MESQLHSRVKLFIINPNRMVGIEKFPDGSFRKVKYVRDTRAAADTNVAPQTPTNTQRLSFLRSLWSWIIGKNNSHL